MKYIVREASDTRLEGKVLEFQITPAVGIKIAVDGNIYHVVNSGPVITAVRGQNYLVMIRDENAVPYVSDLREVIDRGIVEVDQDGKKIYIRERINIKTLCQYLQRWARENNCGYPMFQLNANLYQFAQGWRLADEISQKNVVGGEYVYKSEVIYAS